MSLDNIQHSTPRGSISAANNLLVLPIYFPLAYYCDRLLLGCQVRLKNDLISWRYNQCVPELYLPFSCLLFALGVKHVVLYPVFIAIVARRFRNFLC